MLVVPVFILQTQLKNILSLFRIELSVNKIRTMTIIKLLLEIDPLKGAQGFFSSLAI